MLVTEFIAQGSGTETIVSRGLGPSLVGVPNPLQDPTITLLNIRGQQLDFNNNWMQNPDRQQIIDVGLAPSDLREAAIIDSLAPGTYTTVEQGVNHSQGIALTEVFDLADGGLQLSAVGTRGLVSTADDVMINEIIITGTDPLPLSDPRARAIIGRFRPDQRAARPNARTH